MTIRLLRRGDEARLEAFLRQRAHSSMFLRSNSRHAGLVSEGKPLQAVYVAAFEGDASVAVAAHCWRGRGYGRAAVAGSLLDVKARGVRRAVLFAEREDAKRAYKGIGFRKVGDYGLLLF